MVRLGVVYSGPAFLTRIDYVKYVLTPSCRFMKSVGSHLVLQDVEIMSAFFTVKTLIEDIQGRLGQNDLISLFEIRFAVHSPLYGTNMRRGIRLANLKTLIL